MKNTQEHTEPIQEERSQQSKHLGLLRGTGVHSSACAMDGLLRAWGWLFLSMEAVAKRAWLLGPMLRYP